MNIIEYAASAGLDLDRRQAEQFALYKDILHEYNTRMNLTRITDPAEIELKHFADSVVILPYIIEAAGKKKSLSVVDVGTGAGFPGIPLKIAESSLELTLIDSLMKRVKFLEVVSERLGLKGTKTIHARAEDAGRDKGLRENFDIAIARAVASLPQLCEYCLPFVRVGGIFAAMKTDSDEELENAKYAIKKLGGKVDRIYKYNLPGTDISRSLIIIRKTVPTPAVYPRKAGKPSSEPLMKEVRS